MPRAGTGAWTGPPKRWPDSATWRRASACRAILRALEQEGAECADPGPALAGLASTLAQSHGIPPGRAPVLLGFGQGAALAYAALAASPTTAFHAGFSVDFCPRLPIGNPLCAGRALRSAVDAQGTKLLPSPDQGNGWFVFQANGYCEPEAKAFVDGVGHAKWLDAAPADLDPGGPGRSQVLALLKWLDPGIAGQVRTESGLGDLPLGEIPAAAGRDERLAVMLSGNGGWAALDRGLAPLWNRFGALVYSYGGRFYNFQGVRQYKENRTYPRRPLSHDP